MQTSNATMTVSNGTKNRRLFPRRRLLIAIVLATHTALLAWGASRNSPAYDEVGHMAAGLSHWEFAKFDLYSVNPPLVRLVATFPVWLSDPVCDWSRWNGRRRNREEFHVGCSFIRANGPRSLHYFTLARWACIPFSWIGAMGCYLWAKRLYGVRSGLVALALWCFSPNVIAHGQLITPDLPAAGLGVWALYSFWRWLDAPCGLSAVFTGAAIGLALSTKSTWIVLFILVPGVWLLSCAKHRGALSMRAFRGQACQIAFMLILALYVLNLAYTFAGSLEPIGSFRCISRTLAASDDAPNCFSGTILASVPCPLPRDFVLGLDLQKYDMEEPKAAYLRGTVSSGGWWYYYLYASFVKIPVGTLCLLGLALFTWLWHDSGPRLATGEVILLIPATAILLLVSSQTNLNKHLRYILPAFPFLFIWISRVAKDCTSRRAWCRAATLVGLTATVASSMFVYPHSLSYFNAIAGGPARGGEHLVNSNISWGQDLIRLKEWKQAHPEAVPLYVAAHSCCHPSSLGVDVTIPPGCVDGGGESSPPPPGWYVIDANYYYGYPYGIKGDDDNLLSTRREFFEYFKHLPVVDRVAYSFLVFHVEEHEANSSVEK